MKNLPLFLLAFAVLLIVGGAVSITVWKIPAPSAPVKKVLADDRFSR